MQKIKRDLNGSFTVEAALLMTVLIPLLTALIYLGFYQHDKVWIANKTRTEAMEAALDPDRKKPDGLERSTCLRQRFRWCKTWKK